MEGSIWEESPYVIPNNGNTIYGRSRLGTSVVPIWTGSSFRHWLSSVVVRQLELAITYAPPLCLDLNFIVLQKWYIDGDFQLAPQDFSQLYVIWVPLGTSTVTAVYALLQNKTRLLYTEMLDAVIAHSANRTTCTQPYYSALRLRTGCYCISTGHFPRSDHAWLLLSSVPSK